MEINIANSFFLKEGGLGVWGLNIFLSPPLLVSFVSPSPPANRGYDRKARISKHNSPERVGEPLKLAYPEFFVTMSVSSIPVVSPALLVSLAATPWLVTIVTLQAASGLLEQLGLVSEEIFRGDRLPALHFPVSEVSLTDNDLD
jgi:hypothetical protein